MEMTLTTSDEQVRKSKSAKLILLFAMVSMTMMFAGLTSAFVVSKSRADWLQNFQIPSAFYFSTAVIIGCSITFFLAKKAIQNGNRTSTTAFLLGTLVLGVLFVVLQFRGFGQIIESGYYMTGQGSSITTTFLYVIALMHLLHLAGGLISLLIIIYNHFKQKYNPSQTLGIELGAMYWHFLDLLWVLLFLFLYFFK
ncbi:MULTISPECIES: cytochrome c oxidase subunit 3 [Flavobacterium]|jgi:cytochrome c oxidase subunit 3|uniref:Cytochrome c oxidase, subunit III n=1 Tax=Flavobacterium johnsoniae (strain ATCC 17061 / DSM 2064 / JCM 8514 / BCRC 14874 / CCUG 350202 / NBRC 14942 / NCIMB 11054 / UW101) TaxID=376686 RepID=A5FJD1_FLAJ1|nr:MULTISPECIES: cytochrome c oxidase subunit 3 [Flavobacterium]ABQ04691.1 cytochrome c oxidase, subunit III [Flavobacterium johnsoniae UW101]OXE96465.1 cytochrome oxidase subunit III [Flavobacterium johnsoniae UW101]WDF60401.1 cytochrome c oxidase subunit 3 [Flavobacterium sp. KACC 22758]WQG83512.1 cytochrome c oxidase subunit 3 [Flavobacterium johnsoniae UW101]SHK30648.1 cytochrome c oxidase subunit 3 [Flavobacterium johnsoniae]